MKPSDLTRRNLLKNAGRTLLLPAIPALSGRVAGAAEDQPIGWRNWSGGQSCNPRDRIAPGSEEELAGVLAQASGTIRLVGAGHSFSPLVPTDDTIISLAKMSGLIDSDAAAQQATFWAGTRMADMGKPLQDIGQGLINMADIDRQILAGAISTSTHGTGAKLGSASSYVTALSILTASGEVVECDAEMKPEVFQAARVALGSLGVITRITVQNRERYRLKETIWAEEIESVLARDAELRDGNRHFEMFPMVHSDMAIVQSINITDEKPTASVVADDDGGEDLMRFLQDYGGIFPWLRRWAINWFVGQMEAIDIVGESYDILSNVRNTRFNEMEYEIPLQAGPECLREILRTIEKHNVDIAFPLEYRYVREDDIWLSMFHGRDSCAISVHQFADIDYRPYFDLIEPIFWKYEGRPHWGKLHTLKADRLRSLYPKWQEFLEVRESLDPTGRFLNDHLHGVFGI